MHDNCHPARATCTFSIVVVGAGLYPGPAVEGVIVAVLPSAHQMFSFSGCEGSFVGL